MKTKWRVTATAIDRNGVRVTANDSRTMGDEEFRTYRTEDEARSVACEMQHDVSYFGLDPTTVYSVEPAKQ